MFSVSQKFHRLDSACKYLAITLNCRLKDLLTKDQAKKEELHMLSKKIAKQ